MLYDPKKWDQKTDLSKPSLRALAYLLRHQELWPVGFEWDFGNCDRCAMGLAFSLWDLGELVCAYSMAEHFPISEETAAALFLLRGNTPVVTPEIIADRIDALLKELIDIEGPQPGTNAWAEKVLAAIAKVEGRDV